MCKGSSAKQPFKAGKQQKSADEPRIAKPFSNMTSIHLRVAPANGNFARARLAEMIIEYLLGGKGEQEGLIRFLLGESMRGPIFQ